MTHDTLKDLLNAAPAARVPADDVAFRLAVMARVERKRFHESVAWMVGAALVTGLLLAVVMPYVTPALATLGQALWPAAVLLSLVGAGLVALEQMRRFVRLG